MPQQRDRLVNAVGRVVAANDVGKIAQHIGEEERERERRKEGNGYACTLILHRTRSKSLHVSHKTKTRAYDETLKFNDSLSRCDYTLFTRICTF